MSDLLHAFSEIVGAGNVLTGDAISQRSKNYWDPTPLEAKAIVRPANTIEVSQVLQICHEVNQSVVTHGGLTGLADGDHSTAQDVILSLARMNQIESIDNIGQTMNVEAGCLLEKVQSAALDQGMQYGVDLGARGSCTIGGNIATNAGGLSVLRYGMTREQVLGLEAVLADGTIVSSMNSMMKNNAGYDLKQLFVGSEGTLGVVTKVVLRLRPETPYANTAILAFESFDQVTSTLGMMSNAMNGQLNAFEVMWNDYYCLGTDESIEGTVRPPLSCEWPFYAIVESKGANMSSDQANFESALADALEKEFISDAVISQSEKERADIWSIRENVDIVLSHDPKYIYDVSLPIVEMPAYLDDVSAQLLKKWSDVAFYVYGHLADGNLHLIVAPEPQNLGTTNVKKNLDADSEWYKFCNDVIYGPLEKLGGSVSAEHGIGLEKKPYIGFSRNHNELSMMRLLKQALDARNILNPGKII